MGVKADGKKGKTDAKLAARAARRAKKLAAGPASPSKKEQARKSMAMKGGADSSNPASTTKSLTNNLQHGKWPALFKKHIGLIEAHIKTLDRLMQSMKSQMAEMQESERMAWETGEKGNWKSLCGMMDRSREVLTSARISARDILPADAMKHKSGLGVTGETFEPLGPTLEQRATELKSMRDAQTTEGGDEDTEMSDAADFPEGSSSSLPSSSEDEEIAEQSFVPLVVSTKKRKASNSAAANDIEPNPYFVVDTDPTPVPVLRDGRENSNKKTKKVKSKTDVEQPLSNAEQEEVDFTAIQVQLQAEVEAGLKAQQEAESEAVLTGKDSKRDKKKRKRHSEGLSTKGFIVEKKARNSNNEESNEEGQKKRRASESIGEDVAVVDADEKMKKRNKQHKSAA